MSAHDWKMGPYFGQLICSRCHAAIEVPDDVSLEKHLWHLAQDGKLNLDCDIQVAVELHES